MTNYDTYREGKILFYLEGIRNGSRKFVPTLQIAITDHCFNKCFMCGHWERKIKHVMPAFGLMVFLEKAKLAGLDAVCYSGGDPFQYKDFDLLMQWHISNGVKFGVITAGFRPKYISLDLLKKAEWVRVSLDSIDPDVYAKIRGAISVDLVKASVEEMAGAGVNVQLGITLSKDNLPEIRNIARYAVKLGLSGMRIWPVRANPDLSASNAIDEILYAAYELDYAGIDHNCADAVDILKNGELRPFQSCKAVLFQLFVEPNGDVYPCCIHAGDTNSRNLADTIFGNVLVDIPEDIYGAARVFGKINSQTLPAACKGCTKRLQSMSIVANEHWDDKYFM